MLKELPDKYFEQCVDISGLYPFSISATRRCESCKLMDRHIRDLTISPAAAGDTNILKQILHNA